MNVDSGDKMLTNGHSCYKFFNLNNDHIFTTTRLEAQMNFLFFFLFRMFEVKIMLITLRFAKIFFNCDFDYFCRKQFSKAYCSLLDSNLENNVFWIVISFSAFVSKHGCFQHYNFRSNGSEINFLLIDIHPCCILTYEI